MPSLNLFPAIRIVGPILAPDLINSIWAGEAPHQKPDDFGLKQGTAVKDEIAAAWADARTYWGLYLKKVEKLPETATGTSETRNNWAVPFLSLLGYSLDYRKQGERVNEVNYAISHRDSARNEFPVHIMGCYDELDRRRTDGGPRLSPHGLLQEYLNVTEHLYGLVSNGRTLRLLRDNGRLTPTYVEFDLERIFQEELFADFAILYRLIHVSRMPRDMDSAAESIIENYHQESLVSGTRIRSGLSKAVESSIIHLANGFLSHPENSQLREAVKAGEDWHANDTDAGGSASGLSVKDFYQSLLRLVYRLLFLMVIEERDLVYPRDADKRLRDIYYRAYSLRRLRQLSEKRHFANQRFQDTWLSLCATFRLYEDPRYGQQLGLQALAGDLFAPDALGPLANCQLDNRVLLTCIRRFNQFYDDQSRQVIRVNYAALDVEEFGSVYEGLLDLDPSFVVQVGNPVFEFKSGEDRAASGSHYTPDELCQPLIKHSLDHIIADRLTKEDPERALLSITVCDVACGSGHILLNAARRIAAALATHRTGEEQPSPAAFREALRDVISNCIYGVDLNPLAVELCKVAMWLEAHNPGKPLNFLDHHIKCGNAIVGFERFEDLEKGVPDEAFKRLADDDKDICTALRNRNKAERKEREKSQTQSIDFSSTVRPKLDQILASWKSMARLPESTIEEIAEKKKKYLEFSRSKEAWNLRQIAHLPIAQFYLPKTEHTKDKITTDSTYLDYLKGDKHPQGQAVAQAGAIAHKKRFFHWFLEFPDVMERGGFDCILGNPPYLGGGKLSTIYGDAFNTLVKHLYEPAKGQVDLLCYFIRRIFCLISPKGISVLIGTKSVSQGHSRTAGLEYILNRGGRIHLARTAIHWPGAAVVDVAVFGFTKALLPAYLNERQVETINSSFGEGDLRANPKKLVEKKNRAFKGSEPVGDGFLISHEKADQFKINHPKEAEIIFPFLIGDDVSSEPRHTPSRHCIYVGDSTLEKCEEKYPNALGHLRKFVFPERSINKDKRRREVWWQFSRTTRNLYNEVSNLPHVFVANRHPKYLSLAVVPSSYIYSDATVVIAKYLWRDFLLYSSTIFEAWAWFSGSTIGSSGLRFTPSSTFETFAEPNLLNQLDDQGEHYHDYRKSLMETLWLGLTKIYNLFHTQGLTEKEVAKVSKQDPETAAEGYEALFELRRLHVEMDNAVRDAYGWDDLELEHGFHEVEYLPENDRIRYTISPKARREVLKRLLIENNARANTEEASPTEPKSPAKPQRSTPSSQDQTADLFAEKELATEGLFYHFEGLDADGEGPFPEKVSLDQELSQKGIPPEETHIWCFKTEDWIPYQEFFKS